MCIAPTQTWMNSRVVLDGQSCRPYNYMFDVFHTHTKFRFDFIAWGFVVTVRALIWLVDDTTTPRPTKDFFFFFGSLSLYLSIYLFVCIVQFVHAKSCNTLDDQNWIMKMNKKKKMPVHSTAFTWIWARHTPHNQSLLLSSRPSESEERWLTPRQRPMRIYWMCRETEIHNETNFLHKTSANRLPSNLNTWHTINWYNNILVQAWYQPNKFYVAVGSKQHTHTHTQSRKSLTTVWLWIALVWARGCTALSQVFEIFIYLFVGHLWLDSGDVSYHYYVYIYIEIYYFQTVF